jgi:hypothetical protein
MPFILPSTHQNSLKILRGSATFAPFASDGGKQAAVILSPSSDFSYSESSEQAQYISAESGIGTVLDQTTTSITRSAALTCNRMDKDVFALWLAGVAKTLAQASGSVTGEMTAYAFPNRQISLGGTVNGSTGVFGVSAVSLSSYEGANADDAAVSTAYVVGDVVVPATPNDHWYMATVAGTSAGTAPTWPTDGSTVTDGTVTWQDMGLIDYTASTDYELNLGYGGVNILSTGAIATAVSKVPAALREEGKTFHLSADYTRAAESIDQIATSSTVQLDGELKFYEENPKGGNGIWVARKATLSPTGDFALKSGTNYGAMQFAVTILQPDDGTPALTRNGIPVDVT